MDCNRSNIQKTHLIKETSQAFILAVNEPHNNQEQLGLLRML